MGQLGKIDLFSSSVTAGRRKSKGQQWSISGEGTGQWSPTYSPTVTPLHPPIRTIYTSNNNSNRSSINRNSNHISISSSNSVFLNNKHRNSNHSSHLPLTSTSSMYALITPNPYIIFLKKTNLDLFFKKKNFWFRLFLIQLVENLADVVENGTRDQQTDALVGFLITFFLLFVNHNLLALNGNCYFGICI